MAQLRTKYRGATDFGILPAPAGYVSEIYTTGLAEGTPFAYGTNGTIIKADQALSLPAVGVIVRTDPIAVGTAYTDNPISYAMPKSKMGKINDEEKRAVFTIYENTLRFRAKDETIASTATITGTSGATTLTIAGVDVTSSLKVGDYIEVSQATKVTTKTQISAITFATNTVITTSTNLADTYTGATLVAKTMKGKPVYLGDVSGSTKFSKLGIPYTTLQPATGEWGQEVGYVHSACEIFIDLTKDLLGKTY
jgi:hypothetical protein